MEFYLHADDGPYFSGKNHQQIYQLCWHIINTNYLENSQSLKEALKIPAHYILLDGFEGGGGFFYNPIDDAIFNVSVGSTLVELQKGELKAQWSNFSAFIEEFFGI